MNPTLYALALDVFPLTDEVLAGNAVLGDALQHAMLDALFFDAAGEDPRGHMGRLQLLLRLARDLGLTSPEVVAYLERAIERLGDGR
jgi:hypothetical protein